MVSTSSNPRTVHDEAEKGVYYGLLRLYANDLVKLISAQKSK